MSYEHNVMNFILPSIYLCIYNIISLSILFNSYHIITYTYITTTVDDDDDDDDDNDDICINNRCIQIYLQVKYL